MTANPLDILLSESGLSRDDFSSTSRLGSMFRKEGVEDSPELKRILKLPSYRWQDDPNLEIMARQLKDWLGKAPREDCRRRCGHITRDPECAECHRAFAACACHGDGEMWPRAVQMASLQAAHDFDGAVCSIRVGGGKTLITYLLGSVLGAERVLLLQPAKLVGKTKRDFNHLRRHWMPPKRLHIISYELLSRDRGKAELEAYKPDLVISDEAHKLANKQSTCTRRLHCYLTKLNKEAKYVDLSATLTKRSIKEYYHRVMWAVPDDLQPLPRDYKESEAWSEAIDEKVPSTKRREAGALLQLFSDEALAEYAAVDRKERLSLTRKAFARRLLTAPAIIGTEDQFEAAMPIQIQACEYEVNADTIAAFEGLRSDWETPDGHPIDQASALWRHARELSQGFYYRWDPPPPKEWLEARRKWYAAVRHILRYHWEIDSPMIAARAVRAGGIPWAEPLLAAWAEIRPTFEPHTVAEWIDDSALQYAAKWAAKNTGVIWVNEVAFGRRLSAETGLPYYGRGGLYGKKMIEDETKTCIASVAANCEGRNLQQFHKSLVMSCPPGGNVWEQKLGRMHRDGQMASEILVDLPLVCYEQWDVFCKARRRSRYIEDTTGQEQKLNFADIIVPDEGDLASRAADGDPLWCKDNATFFDEDEE